LVRRAVYRYVDWSGPDAVDGLPVPPAALRYRVHGDLSLESFLDSGRQCAQDLEDALAHVGRDIGSFERVLDFGCGCGRTLRWLQPWSRRSQLFGVDIDEEAVGWCEGALDFVTVTATSEVPPLPYRDRTFDLVYAISVFTHLGEDLQLAWLEELQRVTAPGGYVVPTLRGSFYFDEMSPAQREELRANGFVFSRQSGHMQPIFPEWYQLATHTEDYVRRRYAAFFDVVLHLPRALDGCQDIVLLRRR
jgi:SAM-dependent methyltransferase